MSLNKTVFAILGAILMCLCACSQNVVYTCPFGVGYLTQNDYETMQDGDLISDEFATWLLQTNMYCEKDV